MKRVRGQTLKQILGQLKNKEERTEKKYPLPVLLGILIKVCDALAFAHHRGVIHRDIKPENIMVGEFGEVYLMDWGLSKIQGKTERFLEDLESPVSSLRSESDSSRTIQGTVLGTPAYMSPEQAEGRIDDIDKLSDIYSMGAVLHSLLSFGPPVQDITPEKTIERVWRGMVGPLPQNTPVELKAIIHQAMALKKENRYSSVSEFSGDLDRYLLGFSVSARTDNYLELFRKVVRRNPAVTVG